MKRLPASPRFPGLLALLALFLLASCNWQRPQPGFTLSLNPTSLTVQQGASGQTTLTVTPQNGFTGTVSLSLAAGQDGVPQGLTLSPGSVQVSGASPVNRTLTLSAQAATPTGTYRLKVRATSGSLIREVGLTVTVSPAGGGGGGGGGSGGSGGGGAGGVPLPPPVSGQGFPQPPLEVGPPEQGASLLGQDQLERVLITPQTMTLTPGEERFLSVWVETESGQRYAGDERYLELRWAGPQGYQVAWAGPGRVRVRAPAAFAEETLFISVYRRDLPQAQGKTFLSSVATVGMVEPKPGVVVVPEELVGLPVAYDLDQATLLARLSLFQLEDLRRALDLDGGDGVVTYPALVRIDEARGITAEGLRGQLIVGEGEASPLMGRVREVVARRLDVLLLAVEPALPWEVYARYQGEFDLEAVARQGVLPLDMGRLQTQGEVVSQGLAPQGLAPQDSRRRCRWENPKVEIPLPGQSVQAKFSQEVKCKFLADKLEFVLELTAEIGVGELDIRQQSFKVKLTSSASAQAKFAFLQPVEEREAGLLGGSFFLLNFYTPLFPLPVGVSVGFEGGLAPVTALELMEESGGFLRLPEDTELWAVGGRLQFGMEVVIDTASDPPLAPRWTLSGGFFVNTLFGELDFNVEGETRYAGYVWTTGLGSDLVGFGPIVDFGRIFAGVLKPILRLLPGNRVWDFDSFVGVGVYVYPFAVELEHRFVSKGRALSARTEVEPGELSATAFPKYKLAIRGIINELFGYGNFIFERLPFLRFLVRGIEGRIGRAWFEGQARALPAGLGVRDQGDSLLVTGRLTLNAARVTAVEAYLLADVEARRFGDPLARTTTDVASFALTLPKPQDCENLRPERRTALVVAASVWAPMPLPFGWVFLGQVDLCAPISLEIPPMQGSVGQTARGHGILTNRSLQTVQVELVGREVVVNPSSVQVPPGGSQTFQVSYECREEGFFLGEVEAQVGGVRVALAPVEIACGSAEISFDPYVFVERGSSTEVPMRLRGFNGNVTLSITDEDGFPVQGLRFSPDVIYASGEEMSLSVTLEVSDIVYPGSYSLLVRASSGFASATAPLYLTVQPRPGTQWVRMGGVLDTNPVDYAEEPNVAIDGAGRPIVVWSEYESWDYLYWDIYAKRWNGTHWESLGRLNDINGYFPSLAVDGEGRPVVSWEDDQGRVRVKRWNNGVWESLDATLPYMRSWNGSTKVRTDHSGGVFLGTVITDSNTNEKVVVIARFEEGGWTELVRFSGAPLLDFVVDRFGQPVVAWVGRDDQGSRVLYLGRWSSRGWETRSMGSSNQATITLATDSEGMVYVAVQSQISWHQANIQVYKWYPDGNFFSLGTIVNANPAAWSWLGKPRIAFDCHGSPVVAFKAQGGVVVKRLFGTWTPYGDGADGTPIPTQIDEFDLAVDRECYPVVAVTGGADLDLTVWRWEP